VRLPGHGGFFGFIAVAATSRRVQLGAQAARLQQAESLALALLCSNQLKNTVALTLAPQPGPTLNGPEIQCRWGDQGKSCLSEASSFSQPQLCWIYGNSRSAGGMRGLLRGRAAPLTRREARPGYQAALYLLNALALHSMREYSIT